MIGTKRQEDLSYKHSLDKEDQLDQGSNSTADNTNNNAYEDSVSDDDQMDACPVFLKSLQDTVTVEGCDVHLSCNVFGIPIPKVYWYKEEEIIRNTDNIRTSYDGRIAIVDIRDVISDDQGRYCCFAENIHGSDQTSANLTVNESTEQHSCVRGVPVTFLQNLCDVRATDGDSVRLTVKVTGTAPIEIVWVHNDQQIVDCGEFQYVQEGDGVYSLVIQSVCLEDSGLYVCEAYNDYGDSESFCTLSTINSNSSNYRKIVPKITTTTYCDCNNWSDDGASSTSDDDDEIHVCSSPFINHNRVPQEEVRNSSSHNSSRRNSSDCATGEEKLKCAKPKIIEGLTNIQINEGKAAVLQCKYVCPHPQCSVKWYKDKYELYPSSDIKFEVKNGSSTLRITVATIKHSGIYECRIINDEYGVAITTATLHVKGKSTQPKTLPPIITKGPQSKTTMRGEKVILRTQYTSTDDTNSNSVTWMKGGKEVRPSSRITIDTYQTSSVLTIRNVESDDSGKYIVMVKNDAGQACHFASLAVEGVPEPPPQSPHISGLSDTCLTLSWYGSTYDGGSILTGYTVEMRTPRVPMDDDWKVIVSGCRSTSYIVRDLRPNIQHQFRVRSQNVHGQSEPSKESSTVKTVQLENDESDLVGCKEVEVETEEVFSEVYDVKEEVGRGRFGTVHRVIDKVNGEEKAAKFIKCFKSRDRDKIEQEIDIMNVLRHPKLLQLESAYSNARQLIMVVE
ncbi:Uncharacterised protein r2_g737 [Pycnogonum litorale]